MEEGREVLKEYPITKLKAMRYMPMRYNEARQAGNWYAQQGSLWDENNTRMVISFLKRRGWRLTPVNEGRLLDPAKRKLMRAYRNADEKRTAENRTLRMALNIELDEIENKQGWSSRKTHVDSILSSLSLAITLNHWDEAHSKLSDLREVLGKVNLQQ